MNKKKLSCADQKKWSGLVDDGKAFRDSEEDMCFNF
jgi:hypothetical protein